MWIWIIIIAVVIGALVGFFNRGNIEDALGGAMAGCKKRRIPVQRDGEQRGVRTPEKLP